MRMELGVRIGREKEAVGKAHRLPLWKKVPMETRTYCNPLHGDHQGRSNLVKNTGQTCCSLQT